MTSPSSRIEILRQVENGQLSLLEANRLLFQLEQGGAVSWPSAEPASSQPPEPQAGPASIQPPELQAEPAVPPPPDPAAGPATGPEPVAGEVLSSSIPAQSEPETRPATGWRSLWLLIFGAGLLLALVSTSWMVAGLNAAGLGWGFWLSLFPFALGVFGMWAGWEMRLARWLHVRIRQKSGRPARVAFSIPLPVGLTRWAVQRFGKYSPIPSQDMADLLEQLNQPAHIFVGDENGDQVEIWIEGPE